MKKTHIFTLGLVGSLFIGCGINSQPQVYKIHNNSLQKKAVVKINFPKTDPITNKKINSNIKDINLKSQMIKYSKWYPFHAKTHYHDLIDYAGLKITKKQNYYDLEYKNGFYHFAPEGWYMDTVEFKMPYKIEGNKIILDYPKEYKHIPCQGLITLCMGQDSLDDFDKLETDINRIFNKLQHTVLSIKKRYLLKGEINTKYPANSIYANFKRLMGQYTNNYYWIDSKEKISPIEKRNIFNLKIKNNNYPLYIKVYPYRDGSKVVYKAYISYKINSDGTSTLTKQDIENATKKIKEVVDN